MVGEAQLDLERVDPLPGNLYEIVGAAAEEVKAVGIADKTVAGVDPPLLADGFRGLVRPVPVQRRVGIAAHPQNAFLIVGDVAAFLVAQHDLVAGHAQARGAELFLLRAVAEINMQRFGRAQSLDDLQARQRLPAVEDFGRENLGRRERHAQRREIGRSRILRLGQRRIERRQAEEDARAKTLDRRKDHRRLWLTRQQQRRRADREREGDGIAKAIGEEDLWHREADVVRLQLQHALRKRGLAIGHVVLQMDDALGSSGRAG